MRSRLTPPVILAALFIYVLLQFTWWEILLVRQNDAITSEREKLSALHSANSEDLDRQLEALRHRKKMQTLMIVGEGTIFLLILLYGVSRIRRAQQAEARLGRNQKNFFLSVTHELKTPIAATKLQLQTLAKQELDHETRKELIGKALEENERLNQLIDKVLFASSLESGELVMKKEKTDLSDMAVSIGHRYFRHALESGALTIDAPSGAHAMVDTHLFPSVIINLIENALKYSAASPKVGLRIEKKAGEIKIIVADNGDGIKTEDREKIFERFYRSGDEAVRRSKGTGLGLYIVRYIVKKHEGTISVSDNTPRGSVFQVRLHA